MQNHLPHACNQFESQPMTFPLENPPCYFNIPCSNSLQPFVKGIISAVASDLSANAGTSALRCFAFNFFSKNNWTNPDFELLVAFVTGFADIEVASNRIRDPGQIFAGVVPDAISIYMSQLVTAFTPLRGTLDNIAMNSFNINVGMFNAKMAEIVSYYSRLGIQTQATMQYQGNGGGNMGQMRQWPNNQQPQGMAYPPPMGGLTGNIYNRAAPPAAQLGGTSHFGHSSQSINPVRQDGFFTARDFNVGEDPYKQKQQPAFEPVPVAPPVMLSESSADNWEPTAEQPYRQMIDTSRYSKRYVFRNGKTVEEIEPIEENSMDRNKHTISLLGKTFNMNDVVRKDIVAQQVEHLRNINSQDITDAKQNVEKEPEKAKNVYTYISPKENYDIFLEEAIFQGRKQQMLEQDENVDCNVYRRFVTIAKPYITQSNYREAVASIFTQDNFADMARVLKKYGTSCAATEGLILSTDSEETSKNNHDLVILLSFVDQHLTALVNDWMRNKASLPSDIDSFAEDIEALTDYLGSRWGFKYATEFSKFERQCINDFFKMIDEDVEKEFTDRLNKDGGDLSYTFLPESYSLTYVNVFAKELGIEIIDDEVLAIPEKEMKTLYDIASSIDYQKRAMAIIPAYNLLITQDNKIFRLHKGAIGAEFYLISRF